METLRVYLGNLRETSGVLGNLQSCLKMGWNTRTTLGKGCANLRSSENFRNKCSTLFNQWIKSFEYDHLRIRFFCQQVLKSRISNNWSTANNQHLNCATKKAFRGKNGDLCFFNYVLSYLFLLPCISFNHYGWVAKTNSLNHLNVAFTLPSVVF